jgi:murein DD-endopeptidase MepM/ murein hydrolase activator NlpD
MKVLNRSIRGNFMPDMPTLGAPQKRRSLGPMLVLAMVVGAIAGSAYWWTHRDELNQQAAATAATTPSGAVPGAAVDPATGVVVPAPGAAAAQAQAGAPSPAAGAGAAAVPTVTGVAVPGAAGAGAGAPGSAVPVGAAQGSLVPGSVAPGAAGPGAGARLDPVAAPAKPGIGAFTATIQGPLESSFVQAVGKEIGIPLTQVVNRTLVWWARIPQDLVKGDTVSVVYEPRDGQEPQVHAVRFVSRKMGKTFEAYRFKGANDSFGRFYHPDGSELEERLVKGPLENYEQVTSLLRDGRRHKGVDFKTPVGTPVQATFDGVITRKNWNFRGNGNSIELSESGGQGRTALYLHLSELPRTVQVGQRVKHGDVMATSGNTGHSFAPHLHYQLMKGARVVDPFESHEVIRSTLPSADRGAFDQEVVRLRKLMPAEALAGG